ncbi:THC0290_0291 family protein [Flavobacterium sp. HJJ]|uniref:THC0290_0291 family protein n=1 Tax=Flavobacterium sp. HJJ TaxID=2783792 RepID=UPI00188C8E06|nr:glutamate dehydrogenase [Flavobacterium sp. HJJ]MBF4472892.1 glutamate dehydrogenase [Flavobacterium sp. HJJ]
MSKKITCIFIAFLGLFNLSYAQSSVAHEIGGFFGPSVMKSDYGQRNDDPSTYRNTGFAIGFIHYLNFSSNSMSSAYFKEHFKVRSELSFNQTELNHFGKWTENGNSIGKRQLRAMEGKSSILNLGAQLEYFPFRRIHDFEYTVGSFSPYLSLGLQCNFYNVKSSSSMGELGTVAATFPKYLIPSDGHSYGFSTESSSTWSIVSGVGSRYKLTPLSDLLVEFRLQYFGSDWVDGLNPNKQIFTENKYNDWQVGLTFGYIFYLD